MEVWIFVLPWFTSLHLLQLKMNPVILIMVAIPFFFFGKMNKPKVLISGFFSCDVQFFMWFPILSSIELQCCKIKMESIIQSKNVIFKSCKCWCLLLLLLLLNKWRCYNSLSYVGLCKDFFVRVFFSRVFCFYWMGIVW